MSSTTGRHETRPRVSGTPELPDVATVTPVRQLGRVMAAEWIKARSMPSTWTTLSATLFIMIAIGALISNGIPGANGDGPGPGATEPLTQVFAGVPMSQVALGVLGALSITSEYSSRSIVATLAATPQRGLLLGGKICMLIVLTAPVALVASVAAAAVSLPILRGHGVSLEWTSPGVPRAVLGTAVTLVLTALLGLAVGTLLRSTAAAVIVITVVMFLLPALIALVPAASESVGPWLPSQAGAAVQQLQDRPDHLSPGAGLALAVSYTVTALLAAGFVLRRRNA